MTAIGHEIEGSSTKSGKAAACGGAEWLCLAATPAFAVMALLSGAFGSGMPDLLCLTAQKAWPLNGMVTMYLLMSVFHSAPWLRLLSSRMNRGRGT